MSSPDEVQEDALIVSEDKVEKEEMVGFLTSNGKIRNTIAEKLYDQGLDNWASFVNGDESYFTSFKGVGKKTADSLVELAREKMEEIRNMGNIPTLQETLAGIPRVSKVTIDTLIENGFDTYQSFKDLEAEKLQELKGVGPKLSITIVEKVNEVREKFGIEEDETHIEDATGVEGEKEEEEKEDEKGLIQKIIDWIKALFSGKKKEEVPDEETPEEDKEDEEPVVAEEEPVVEEEEPAEEKVEEPVVEDEAPQEEEKEEETLVEEEEAPAEESEGFFQKLKNKFSGEKKEEEEPVVEEEELSEEKVEEPVAEEEAPKEEEEPAEEAEEEPKEKKSSKGPLGLEGISVGTQEKLIASGYHNIDELREAVPADLLMIDGIGKKTAERICDAVK